MTPAHLVRTARRVAGVSQRRLAELSGVHARTIGDIEAGRASPNVATLERLLAAAGCELALDRALPEPDVQLERHLRLSLTTRLFVTLGGRRWADPPPAWAPLWRLVHHGTVQLLDAVAVGVWTPEVVDRPRVRVHRVSSARALPQCDELDLECVDDALPPGLVPVRWRIRPVHVQTPYELALSPVSPGQRLALRAAAALLDADGARDDGGRRAPAHRDVDHWRDREVLDNARLFRQLPYPPEHDARGWRLAGPVSLAQWLRRHGYPT